MFGEQSTEEEIDIEVSESILILSLEVNIGLSLCKMKVEIVEVNGEVVREIKLNSYLTSKKIFAKGNLREKIKQHEPGIWKVKFYPGNAKPDTSVFLYNFVR